MSILSDKALLVSVNVSQWTATRLDKRATSDVTNRANADADAARVNKSLLPKEALADIVRIAGAARTFHYAQTLPWLFKGADILPAKLFRDYRDKMDGFKAEFLAAVDTFLTRYETFRQNAPRRLGSMFNPAEYPSRDEIERKFGFSVDYSNVPEADDFRVDIGDANVARIKADIEARSAAALASVSTSILERIADVLTSMVDRLSAYQPGTEDKRASGTFKDSLVGNVQKLCDILPSLNLTGDKRIDHLTSQLEALANVTPGTLRDSETVRQATKDRAADILSNVNE
jgi:hypothetical protein